MNLEVASFYQQFYVLIWLNYLMLFYRYGGMLLNKAMSAKRRQRFILLSCLMMLTSCVGNSSSESTPKPLSEGKFSIQLVIGDQTVAFPVLEIRPRSGS